MFSALENFTNILYWHKVGSKKGWKWSFSVNYPCIICLPNLKTSWVLSLPKIICTSCQIHTICHVCHKSHDMFHRQEVPRRSQIKTAASPGGCFMSSCENPNKRDVMYPVIYNGLHTGLTTSSGSQQRQQLNVFTEAMWRPYTFVFPCLHINKYHTVLVQEQ